MGNKAHIKIDEEKQLLIKDLCARLPYHLRGKSKDGKLYEATVIYDTGTILASEVDGVNTNICCGFKPYLRSLSSMSAEEIEKYIRLRHKDCIDVERPAHCCKNSITAVVVTLTSRESMRYWYNDMVSTDTIDFLNEHYLDWRGLIPLGLALEAPEDMYKYEKGGEK